MAYKGNNENNLLGYRVKLPYLVTILIYYRLLLSSYYLRKPYNRFCFTLLDYKKDRFNLTGPKRKKFAYQKEFFIDPSITIKLFFYGSRITVFDLH
jgi:hypothetical protein